MYKTATRIIEKIEQWRENSSTDDTLTSLTSIETFLEEIPQTKDGLAPHYLSKQEPTTFQEPPWLWFTLPELRFPLLTYEYRRPIHPEIEEYILRYVSDDQDWEQIDDEDC